jgi:hypothetical protein
MQQANTQLKNDTVKDEQDTNQQLDQLMRQESSLQRVIHNLKDETESLKEEIEAGIEKMTYPSGAGALYNFYSFS